MLGAPAPEREQSASPPGSALISGSSIAAGRDVFIAESVTVLAINHTSAPDIIDIIAEQVRQRLSAGPVAEISDRTVTKNPVEQLLNDQIDQFRDRIRAGDAATALGLLQNLLGRLPSGASPQIIFRVKANIGYCHLQLGDEAVAAEWLTAGYDAAPEEPRAIANKVFAMILEDRPREAFDFARAKLLADPDNEHLAANLLRAAAVLDDEPDPIDLIAPALLEREEVALSQLMFLKLRTSRQNWWNFARRATERFPEHEMLRFFAAESHLDEATFDGAFQRPGGLHEDLRNSVSDAAIVFDGALQKIKASATPNRREILLPLSAAMLAHQILGHDQTAAELAEDFVTRVDDEEALLNIAQVARGSKRLDLAFAALDRIPGGSTRGDFIRGMLHLDRGEWKEAGECFVRADLPEEEEAVARTVIFLAELKQSGTADETQFLRALEVAAGDARALIVVAREAKAAGFVGIETTAFEQASVALNAGSTMSERSMVAMFASESGNAKTVIDVLDGCVSVHHVSRDLITLAEAHALEHPKRERNLAFFKSLSGTLRELPEIARSYATVLLDAGQATEAELIFRSLIQEEPSDVYVYLRLLEILIRLGREGEFKDVILPVDEAALQGPSEYLAAFARALHRFKESERALKLAYRLVREFPTNPKVALSYVFLILEDQDEKIIPDTSVVGDGAWVRLQNAEKTESREFVIEEGRQFLGIETISPADPQARQVEGLRVGQTIVTSKGPFPDEIWSVSEVKSKYLHLLHLLMNQFERRFPGENGLWRVDIRDDDLSSVFDFVRAQAEAEQENAKLYTERGAPLLFVARMMGKEPAAFADLVRSMGANIITCLGNEQEREIALSIVRDAKGKGAVLDPYTAWVAAEMGILDVLSKWFGRISTPASTVGSIDRLIRREEESLGKKSMSLGWRNGEFVRREASEDYIQSKIAALNRLKADIQRHCTVENVLIPDNLPALAQNLIEKFGSRLLDPIILAGSKGAPLICDDLFYRQYANAVNGTTGAWLQVVVTAAFEDKEIDVARLADAIVVLAARRHSHVSLNLPLLEAIYESGLEKFEIAVEYIGGPTADNKSHTILVAFFLTRLWRKAPGDLKCQQATGIILRRLACFRPANINLLADLLGKLWDATDRFAASLRLPNALYRYISAWIQGHFY